MAMRCWRVFIVVWAGIVFLALAGVAGASAQSEYQKGLSLFKALLPNEKKAGLREEWQAEIGRASCRERV